MASTWQPEDVTTQGPNMLLRGFLILFDAFWLAAQADGTPGIPHQSQLKVRLEANDGSWHDRVPAWTKLAWQALCQPF